MSFIVDKRIEECQNTPKYPKILFTLIKIF